MSKNQEEWRPCPPGELSRLTQRLRSRRRRRNFLKVASIASIAALGGIGIYWMTQPEDQYYAELYCSDVKRLAKNYANLPQAKQNQIIQHAKKCNRCGPMLKEMGIQF